MPQVCRPGASKSKVLLACVEKLNHKQGCRPLHDSAGCRTVVPFSGSGPRAVRVRPPGHLAATHSGRAASRTGRLCSARDRTRESLAANSRHQGICRPACRPGISPVTGGYTVIIGIIRPSCIQTADGFKFIFMGSRCAIGTASHPFVPGLCLIIPNLCANQGTHGPAVSNASSCRKHITFTITVIS